MRNCLPRRADPKQLRIHFLAGGHQPRRRGDDFGRDQVVAGESDLRASQRTPTDGEPAIPVCETTPPGCASRVLRCPVQLTPEDTGSALATRRV